MPEATLELKPVADPVYLCMMEEKGATLEEIAQHFEIFYAPNAMQLILAEYHKIEAPMSQMEADVFFHEPARRAWIRSGLKDRQVRSYVRNLWHYPPSLLKYEGRIVPPLKRGGHTLPHQSQTIGRDLNAEQIFRHWGEQVYCYRLTPEQIDECKTKPGRGLPYEFHISSPGASSMAWTAFYTADALYTWMSAYGITGLPDEPGKAFYITLPQDESAFQPLND